MRYPRLAARLFNTPIMIEANAAELLAQVLRSRQSAEIDGELTRLESMEAGTTESTIQLPKIESASLVDLVRRTDKQYDMTRGGIAVIPVVGKLVQRTGGMQPFSGMVPYAWIGRKVAAAMDDGEVKGILLELDTPGGECAGLFEMCTQLLELRGKKPLWMHGNEKAYSAGYAIACCGDKFFLPMTGGACNIGALMLHLDQSKADAQQGLVYTYIYSGERKKDGNPHEPLSKEAAARAWAEVERMGGIFVAHVANARPDLQPDDIEATEGACLNAEEAVDQGFADGIKTFAETVEAFEKAIGATVFSGARLAASRPSTLEKESIMQDPKNPAANSASAATDLKHTDAQLNAAVDQARTTARAEGVTEGTAAGTTAGTAAGVKAERDRVRGILAHAEAKDRPQLAMSLALESDLSVEAASKVLAKAGKEANGGAFAGLMAGLKNPQVGADLTAGVDDVDVDTTARRLAGVKPAAAVN